MVYHFTSTEVSLIAAGMSAGIAFFALWRNSENEESRRRADSGERQKEREHSDHTRFLDQRRTTYLQVLRELRAFNTKAGSLEFYTEGAAKGWSEAEKNLEKARNSLWEATLTLDETLSELAALAPKPVQTASDGISQVLLKAQELDRQYELLLVQHAYKSVGTPEELSALVALARTLQEQAKSGRDTFVTAIRTDLRVDHGAAS